MVLVEDDEVVAAGLVALLECEGIAVHVASTGGAAVGVIAECDPDVVVLDLGLPDMDGTEVFRAIRQRWSRLPVVFSTGHPDVSRLEGTSPRGLPGTS